MQPLKYLILHCSATQALASIKSETLIAEHRRKWGRPGYRVVVELDGKAVRYAVANDDAWVQPGEVTYGVGPQYNACSHHVCYMGGLAKLPDGRLVVRDTRTAAQRHTLATIIHYYLDNMAPDILIMGHNQAINASRKACPSFWVPKFCREIGVPERNICQDDPYGYAGFNFG